MKGLTTQIPIKNGAITLTEGVEKSRDNIWFFCIFDKFRVYCTDFGGDFVLLQQKPASYLIENATLLITRLRKGIEKYVPNVKVKSLDVGYMGTDRKQYTVMIEYSSVQDNKNTIEDVTFV